ncbi:conserved hypothetical protein [Cyanobium sp. PCC 7001]|uniref:hypothetical protein n=1 Tax=Cyanobium sp. PCC 7001 TaxID=180281 RepID=UPI00018053DF|nr:hypothetical protein [Cyanobium sp. PCC 7001]EDY38677.1 conserved hypothetical protein [Cyanobium sp. PCC 7001]
MVFKRKGFFLDLSGGDGGKESKPAKVAIAQQAAPEAAPAPAKGKAGANAASKAQAPAPAATEAATEAVTPVVAAAVALTTAEAIAAELRAAQEALPPPSQVTFAPDCLNPANALPMKRRRPGANLGAFKAMADQMFRS